jgi:AmmeMemoRadiSam system protein A
MGYDHVLSDDERRELLRIARATLRDYLTARRVPAGKPHPEGLLAGAGAFVTLHKANDLRGCIGTFSDSQPLYRAVQEMAISAATQDPRFAPLRVEELGEVEIEISVLSGLRLVGDPSQVQVGVHGLQISASFRRGVLLPQVATEHAWDRETFLRQTCRKAGLPEDSWKLPDTRIEVFTAQVFGERTLGGGAVPGTPATPPF